MVRKDFENDSNPIMVMLYVLVDKLRALPNLGGFCGKMLLSSIADSYTTDEYGWIALMWASYDNRYQVIEVRRLV